MDKHPLDQAANLYDNKQAMQTSTNTASTDNNCLKRLPSLVTCHSSLSIEQGENARKFTLQKKLFMKFLLAIQHKNEVSVTKAVEKMYTSYKKSVGVMKNQEKIFGCTVPSIQCEFVLRGILETNFMDFLFSIWLGGMGYKTAKNKQKILQKIKDKIPNREIYQTIVFYQHFGYDFLNPEQRWKLAINTCLNGWQYFGNKIIQYWKNGKLNQKFLKRNKL